MGASAWSDKTYNIRSDDRKKRGTDAFDYDRTVKAIGDLVVHDKLNPLNVKFRESRDSDSHPESRAIAVIQDVTGSMSMLPKIMCEKLKTLMSLLIKKGYVEHPQILFGAVGDATWDRVPLQIGQFESGIEMDDDLSRLVLEGGGGGHITESYELALYFMANHIAMDCLGKRGEKGYLFIIGDEIPYDKVKKHEVEKLIGDHLQSDLATSETVQKLKEQFEVFVIVPAGSSHAGDRRILEPWKAYFGQNVIELDDINAISETIAATIGLAEGKVGIDMLASDLKDVGAKDVTSALVPYAKTAKSVSNKKATVEGDLVLAGDANVEML